MSTIPPFGQIYGVEREIRTLAWFNSPNSFRDCPLEPLEYFYNKVRFGQERTNDLPSSIQKRLRSTQTFDGRSFYRMLYLCISEQRVFLTLMNDRTVLLRCRVQDNGFILIDVAFLKWEWGVSNTLRSTQRVSGGFHSSFPYGASTQNRTMN